MLIKTHMKIISKLIFITSFTCETSNGGQTQPHHYSQHMDTGPCRESKAHICKCHPMAYIIMVVRSNRQDL